MKEKEESIVQKKNRINGEGERDDEKNKRCRD